MNFFEAGKYRCVWFFFVLWIVPVGEAFTAPELSPKESGSRIFNVELYGAKGDGQTLDTRGVNEAIDACAAAGGGQVLFPPGRYLSGTVHLRSNVTLFLSAGAALAGTANLAQYAQPTIPTTMPEARWGKWHRALILGEGVENASICGLGLIDGNKVFDPTGEERMRGPHTIVLVNCRNISFRDFSIKDSANYAMFFQVSDELEIRRVKITGGWDGIHFRGAPDRWCRNVDIVGCSFETGDDSIAGRYWDRVLIADCIINSSCNGLRLIGPARGLTVTGCLFEGPGRQPHRSSGRTNMLSGIILQPGAWDKTEGVLDKVYLANNTMVDVASPVTVWTKPGNPVGTITIDGLRATGVYRSAISVESWSEMPITNVTVRNASISFTGGGSAEQANQAVKGPGVDARKLPSWGIFARNVQTLKLEDVRLSLEHADLRPVIRAEKVEELVLDQVRYDANPGVEKPLVTTEVGNIRILDNKIRAE